MEDNLSKTDELRIRTSIKGSFYRKKMLQGTFIALLGMLVILIGGALVTPSTVLLVGIPVLIIGGFLIGAGLLPLRRLNQIEKYPNELVLLKGHLVHVVDGKPVADLPLDKVKKMDYVEDGSRYGIEVTAQDATFFFPYFERRQFSRFGLVRKNINAKV